MKKTLLLLAIALLTLGILAVAFVALRPQPQEPLPPDAVSFPGAGTGPGTVFTREILLANGAPLETHDFLSDPATVEDEVNPGYYYLGYGPADSSASYHIEYVEETQYFNVELLQEPLGESRKAAEAYLQRALGIANDDMCALNYALGVPNSVNGQYSSMNLGFSFCPGAVVLP
jgi:hypothetical protein